MQLRMKPALLRMDSMRAGLGGFSPWAVIGSVHGYLVL